MKAAQKKTHKNPLQGGDFGQGKTRLGRRLLASCANCALLSISVSGGAHRGNLPGCETDDQGVDAKVSGIFTTQIRTIQTAGAPR